MRKWGVILALIVGSIGTLMRSGVAFFLPTRICVDEIWYFLNPAFKLAHGLGVKIDDPQQFGMRGFFFPSLLSLYLRLIKWIGVPLGKWSIAFVQGFFSLWSLFGMVLFVDVLRRQFKLSVYYIFLPIFILFWNPEFIHSASTAELNVIALPLFFIWLWSETVLENPQKKMGGLLALYLSVLLRVQFSIFLIFFLIKKFLINKKDFLKSVILGVLLMGINILFETGLYHYASGGEKPKTIGFGLVFPAWNYFYAHAFEGLANRYGVSPFYLGFEYLWRLMSEPIFIAFIIMIPSIYKHARLIFFATVAYFFIHCFSGHKEVRFFYPAAVIFSGYTAAALAKYYESTLKEKTVQFGLIIALIMTGFIFRANYKVQWGENSIPAVLETYAGEQKDVKGLVVSGYLGSLHGGHYTFQSTKNYAFTESLKELRSRKLNADEYNYLILPNQQNQKSFCQDIIYQKGGAVLWRCSPQEMKVVLQQRDE